jgi:PAS domain S-box-containing protein
MGDDSVGRQRAYLAIVIFVLLAGAIVVAAFRYYYSQKDAVEVEVENQLNAIADMKAAVLAGWRVERLGDARMILASDPVLSAAAKVLDGSASASERAGVERWLASLCRYQSFANAILTDRRGNQVLSAGQMMGSREHLLEITDQAIRADGVVERDFHREANDGVIHLGFNLPIRKPGQSTAVGALLLGIDPRRFLYPFLQQSLTPSKSSEVVLARRVGNEIVFLNELRHRRDAALNLRIPVSRTDIAVVQAVLGVERFIHGRDYRGTPVVAAIRRVSGSPWFLVAKVDAEEVYAPIRQRTAVLAVMVGSLILAAGSLVAFAWRRQQLRHLQERYRAELERNTLAGRYDFLSRFANDIVLLIDEEGRIIEANDRASTAYGYSRDELLRLNVRDLRHPSAMADLESQWRAVETAEGAVFETVHRRRDGSELPVEVSARLVGEGGRRFRQSVIRDITERKRAEEEQRKLQQQLVQAQKMESIGQLAGGVAHDFNNHLTVINGYCDLLLNRVGEGSPLAEQIGQVRRAGEQAARLTQQLLAFSRRQMLEPVTLNLNQVIADSMKMLKPLIGENIEVETHLSPDLHLITADPGQILQVLMNLTTNARDAMPDGGRIVVETLNVELDRSYADRHAEVTPGSYVLLAVSDTGLGMDEETRGRIFEPFFTTKGKGAGTGLGLSTVFGIVRQSGGWIWVYSEPGKGAAFKLYFPKSIAAAAVAAPAAEPARAAPRGTETVLVVEDQDEVRGLTTTILRGYGYHVLEAANGAEALKLCESFRGVIHLLVTDVVMPGMNGRELADRLNAVRPETRVLFTSGYTANVISKQGVLDPGVAFLPKPFLPEGLAAKVREVLGEPESKGTILVADDEESIRCLLRQILNGGGYEVLEAPDGLAALNLVRRKQFDVALVDLAMPVQEGFQTLREMRELWLEMKTIAISGAYNGDFSKAARDVGASDALRKPIRPDDLLRSVRQVLEG